MNTDERPDRISGTATSTLPAGMTQEEADRLVAEADARSTQMHPER